MHHYYGNVISDAGYNRLVDRLVSLSSQISTAPNDTLLAERALIRFGMGNEDKAVKDLEDAIKINPANSHYYHYYLGRYFSFGQCRYDIFEYDASSISEYDWFADSRDLPRALSHYDNAIKHSPNNHYFWCLRGEISYVNGRACSVNY